MCTSSVNQYRVDVVGGVATVYVNECPILNISVETATKIFRDLSAQHRVNQIKDPTYADFYVDAETVA